MRVMSLLTSTGLHCIRYTHCLRKPTYSNWSPCSLARLSFSSFGSFTINLRTGTPWKCAQLLSYIARVRLLFRLFLIGRDQQREECFHTFLECDMPLKRVNCRGNIRFLHGLLDLSHDQPRSVVWSMSMSIQQDGLSNAHATTPLDSLFDVVA